MACKPADGGCVKEENQNLYVIQVWDARKYAGLRRNGSAIDILVNQNRSADPRPPGTLFVYLFLLKSGERGRA
jgi:hypothetical protein